MKEKIASFEDDDVKMENTFALLSAVLEKPYQYDEIIDHWISGITYYVLPKNFKRKESTEKIFVSDEDNGGESIDKINFFINMPFELYLLDSLWCLLMGKIVADSRMLEYGCYGNCIATSVTYNAEKDYYSSINFDKNRLFKIYFPEYCRWKNEAIEMVKEKTNHCNIALVTLDIKSYYYSVNWEFSKLCDLFQNDDRLVSITNLTNIIEKIFIKYTDTIKKVRKIPFRLDEYTTLLPIGLFSSMLIANIYLAQYDKYLFNQPNILYYGRYVDDMLLVMNTEDKILRGNQEVFDNLLIKQNKVLQKITESDQYCLRDYPSLKVQKEKVKVIFFEKKKSDKLLKILESTKIVPSEMEPLPDIDLKLEDFEDAAYAIKNLTRETKIRDINQFEIDRLNLGQHMHKVVLASKPYFNDVLNGERQDLEIEKKKILKFFRGSNALNYCSNWINAFYFFVLSQYSPLSGWDTLKKNISGAIDDIIIDDIEEIHDECKEKITERMKNSLREMLNIAMATALSLNPAFSPKENEHVRRIAVSLRHANLFNHQLVSLPLINYYSTIPDTVDLTRVSIGDMHSYIERIKTGKKIRYSPRFIRYSELFYYYFLYRLGKDEMFLGDKRVDAYLKENDKTDEKKLIDFFFEINKIKKADESVPEFDIKQENIKEYRIQRINLGDKARYERKKGEKTRYLKQGEKIRIAVANFDVKEEECLIGLPGVRKRTEIDKASFRRCLNKAFHENVDYILLPEFYLPYEWISDVLSYVERTGISIISGLKYVTFNQVAHNKVAFFGPIYSGKNQRYRGACLLAREKNDYAPEEKKNVIDYHARCIDQEQPVYQIIKQNGLKIGIFLCYEFTDIKARALYKNEVDIVFTPEFNKDTPYFGNIIESFTRDLHTFVVQSNTAHYGDSRITGPYNRDNRDIVMMKGGDTDEIIIGTIDVKGMWEYEKIDAEEMEQLNNGKPPKAKESSNRYIMNNTKTFKKPSARFKRLFD
ncbi:MAG: hypothetical protein K6G60_07140 [Lachnospiraceae bacterium]|nr:hypothetical protein [Lachnospiraceae bacterium]